MATTDRDYYELLGVARDASEGEIKGAFRRLARELHPDVSEAPDADERFREVVEAYEVLSKTETRELYDRYGHAGLRSGGFDPGHVDFGNLADLFSAFFGDEVLLGGRGRGGNSRGADLAAIIEIDLVEAARGVTREVPFEAAVTCTHCGGDGAEPGSEISACPTCNGSGRLQQVTRSVFGEFVRTQTCPTCSGSGRRIERAVRRMPRRRPNRRGASRHGRDPAGDPSRPADSPERRGARRASRRPRRRRARRGQDPSRRAVRPRRRRRVHDRRPHLHPGRARCDRPGPDTGG